LCSHIEIIKATWKTKATYPGMDTGSVAVHELAKRYSMNIKGKQPIRKRVIPNM
jgi:hypothetical protein